MEQPRCGLDIRLDPCVLCGVLRFDTRRLVTAQTRTRSVFYTFPKHPPTSLYLFVTIAGDWRHGRHNTADRTPVGPWWLFFKQVTCRYFNHLQVKHVSDLVKVFLHLHTSRCCCRMRLLPDNQVDSDRFWVWWWFSDLCAFSLATPPLIVRLYARLSAAPNTLSEPDSGVELRLFWASQSRKLLPWTWMK